MLDACGARLPDPITPAFTHVCSRVDDHSCSPKWQHWDHVTDLTWPVEEGQHVPYDGLQASEAARPDVKNGGLGHG